MLPWNPQNGLEERRLNHRRTMGGDVADRPEVDERPSSEVEDKDESLKKVAFVETAP